MFNLSVNDIIGAVFNIKIFSTLFGILCIYFISYLISIVSYSSKDETTLLNGRALILNILLFPHIIGSIFTVGGSASFNDAIIKAQTFLNTPTSIFSVLSFIVGFYCIIYFVGIPMTNALKPSSISFIDSLAWFIFTLLLVCDFFAIFFNISLSNLIFGNILDKIENKHSSSDNSSNDISGDEVFNISNNIYTYHDAQEVCSVYGAKLATYDQVEDSYNKGGEWCNYGWSEGQMALFPTQKSTWNTLQGSEETKNQCGRPGINGGFMENPHLLFGINCYGKKPHASDKELKMMQANQNIKVPNTPKDIAKNAKLEFLKNNQDTLLVVNPFKRGDWSEW
jgi:hypothetical protein